MLDFKNHQAGADRVHTSARQKHHIAGFDRHSMKTIGHRAVVDSAFKLRAGDATAQPGVKFRARSSVGDVPHLRLRFAAEPRGDVGGRVDLQGEFFLRVEQFSKQRKTSVLRSRGAEQFLRVMLHQPAQIFSGERPVGNHARGFGPVGDFPRFADGNTGWQGLLVQPFQIAPAPDAFFENGLEHQWIKHAQ